MGIYELDNSLSERALYWLVEKKTHQNHFSCLFFWLLPFPSSVVSVELCIWKLMFLMYFLLGLALRLSHFLLPPQGCTNHPLRCSPTNKLFCSIYFSVNINCKLPRKESLSRSHTASPGRLRHFQSSVLSATFPHN